MYSFKKADRKIGRKTSARIAQSGLTKRGSGNAGNVEIYSAQHYPRM
jgi:hypothetical protein